MLWDGESKCWGSLKFPTVDHRNSLGPWAQGRSSARLLHGPGHHLLVQEIGHRNSPIAVWTGAAEADPAHEGPAVLTALVADRAGAAGHALVHGEGPAGTLRGHDDGDGRGLAAPAVGGVPAQLAAVPLTRKSSVLAGSDPFAFSSAGALKGPGVPEEESLSMSFRLYAAASGFRVTL